MRYVKSAVQEATRSAWIIVVGFLLLYTSGIFQQISYVLRHHTWTQILPYLISLSRLFQIIISTNSQSVPRHLLSSQFHHHITKFTLICLASVQLFEPSQHQSTATANNRRLGRGPDEGRKWRLSGLWTAWGSQALYRTITLKPFTKIKRLLMN